MILASLVRFYLLHNYNIIRLYKVLLVACKLQAILYRDSVLHYLCRVILCVECTASAHRTIALVMRRPQGDGRLLWLL